MDKLHPTLRNQLNQLGINPQMIPREIRSLIENVNATYLRFTTERKQLQGALRQDSKALKRVRAELDVIFSTFPDLYFRLDEHNRLLDCKIGLDDQAYPPLHHMLQQSVSSFPWPELKETLLNAIDQVRNTRSLVNTRFSMMLGARLHHFEARLLPVREKQMICVIRNVTEARTAELELIKSEQRFRTVLESSPDPIIVFDMAGNPEYLNPAFSKVFGWSFAEFRSGSVDFVPPDAQEKTLEKIRQMKDGKDVQGFETQRLNRDGAVLDVIINASLRMDTENNAVGSVVTIVDITRLKKLEAELRFTKNQAESSNRAKSEFLANMSHELRTPMHGILGFAKIILEKMDALDKTKIQDYMAEIFNSGERLMHLLNDLLDISKLEAGRVDYDMKTGSLSDIVKLVIQEFRPVSGEKRLNIRFEKTERNDQAVFDRNKMIQVVRNLLSNAIKFSHPQGKILIKISNQSGLLMLSITDFGIGIPSGELDVVFDKFVQSSKSKSELGGTGLGLAICSEIVAAHEGRIWAKNNAEGGTTFFVSLFSA